MADETKAGFSSVTYDAKMKGGTHLEKVHVSPSKNWVMRRSAYYFQVRRLIKHMTIYTCGLLSLEDLGREMRRYW